MRRLATLLFLLAAPIARPQGVQISLAPSGVTPGAYTCPSATVDTFGRVTAIANGTCGSPAPNGLSTANVLAEFPLTEGTGLTATDIVNGHLATLSGSSLTWSPTGGVVFPGGNESLTYSDSASWGTAIKAIEIVYTHNVPGGSATHGNGPTAPGVYSCWMCGSTSGSQVQFIDAATGSGPLWIYPNTQATMSGAGTHVLIAWNDGTKDHISIDGSEGGYSSQGNQLSFLSNSSTLGAPLVTGHSPIFGGSEQAGTIHYVRFLSAVPPVSQDTAALTQIVSRRGVAFNPKNLSISSHLTVIGDSRTYGTGSSVPYGDYLNQFLNFPYPNVSIFGMPGYQAVTLKYYPPGRECLVGAANGTYNDALLNEGTNDLFGNQSVAATWAAVQQHAAALRACGYRHIFLISDPDRIAQPISGTFTYAGGVSGCSNGTQSVSFTNGGGSGASGSILVSGGVPVGAVSLGNFGGGFTSAPTTATISSCSGTATLTGGGLAEQVYDNVQRANWQQSFDGFVDLATNTLLAPSGNNSGSAFFISDGIHLDAGGYTTEAMYAAKAINAFYGSSSSSCDPATVTTSPYQMLDGDGCKSFDTQAGASTVTMGSALGISGRVVRLCNSPSGAGSSLTVNVATTTPTSNSAGVVASAAIPAAEYFNVPGATSITIPVNTCKVVRSAIQNTLTGGSFWSSL